MDKKTAEDYVIYGLKSLRFSKKTSLSFLPFNILLLIISVIMFHEIWFVVLVIMFVVINLIVAFTLISKWSAFSCFLSLATQMFHLALALDCIDFAMYKVSDLFVWYEYLICIIIQIIAFLTCFILISYFSKKHNKNKKPVANVKVSVISSLVFITSNILFKIFLPDIELSVVLTILSVLINLMLFLSIYVVCGAVYKAYLINKFKLEVYLN